MIFVSDGGKEEDGCHGADGDEEHQGDGWNSYWGEGGVKSHDLSILGILKAKRRRLMLTFLSNSCACGVKDPSSPHVTSPSPLSSSEAQHGEALLWTGWSEKHPEGAEGTAGAPWDDPEMRSMWDEHASEIYCSYWERFSYWASQGWTMDGNGGGGEAAAETENRQEEELSTLLEGSCTFAADQEASREGEGGGQQLEAELGGSERPSDGGGDEQRPAGPPQQHTAEQTGMCIT